MKTIVPGAAIAALLVTLAPAAFADSAAYECKMDVGRGWIMNRMLIQVDEGAGKAWVFDGLIKAVEGAPLVVPFKETSEGEIKVKWTIRNVPVRWRTNPVTYYATLEPSNGDLRLRANVHGADNKPRGTGKCWPAKFNLQN